MSASQSDTSSGAPDHRVACVPQRGGGIVEGVEDRPAEDERPDRVQPVLERDDDAEVAGSTAQTPEQIGMLICRRRHEPPVGSDEVDREQVVDRQAVLPRQPADAAAESQPGDAGVGDLPAGDSQPECLRLAIDVAPERARLRPRRACGRIDPDALHPREIEHDPAVAGRVARRRVAASPHGERGSGLAGVVHDRDDVDRAERTDDREGLHVEHAVPDPPRRVVVGVYRGDQLTAQLSVERFERW